MTMERGGEYQEEMDISFHYIIGTPEREVKEIKEVWPTGYHGYNDIIANKYFAPRKIPLDTAQNIMKSKPLSQVMDKKESLFLECTF